MIFDRMEALHLVGPQTRLQALDQLGQAFAFAPRRRKEFLVRRRPTRDVVGLQAKVERRRG